MDIFRAFYATPQRSQVLNLPSHTLRVTIGNVYLTAFPSANPAGASRCTLLGSAPLRNAGLAEEDVEEVAKIPEATSWTFIPVEAPWLSSQWSQIGGRGESPYPKGEQQTTIRVPKNIAYQVKQYAVWLSRQ